MNVIFWVLAAVAGAGFGFLSKTSGILDLNKGPTSVLFMLLSLIMISVLYQFRVNLARDRGKPGFRPAIVPPAPDVFIDAIFFFAAALVALRGLPSPL